MPLSLEALVQQARAQLAAKEQRKHTRLQATPDSAGADHEWYEVYQFSHYTARFWHQRCTCCGSAQTGLEGIYEVRKHPRFSQTIARRMGADSLQLMHPGTRQLEVATEQVPACLFCTEQLGFPREQVLQQVAAKEQQPC